MLLTCKKQGQKEVFLLIRVLKKTSVTDLVKYIEDLKKTS